MVSDNNTREIAMTRLRLLAIVRQPFAAITLSKRGEWNDDLRHIPTRGAGECVEKRINIA